MLKGVVVGSHVEKVPDALAAHHDRLCILVGAPAIRPTPLLLLPGELTAAVAELVQEQLALVFSTCIFVKVQFSFSHSCTCFALKMQKLASIISSLSKLNWKKEKQQKKNHLGSRFEMCSQTSCIQTLCSGRPLTLTWCYLTAI